MVGGGYGWWWWWWLVLLLLHEFLNLVFLLSLSVSNMFSMLCFYHLPILWYFYSLLTFFFYNQLKVFFIFLLFKLISFLSSVAFITSKSLSSLFFMSKWWTDDSIQYFLVKYTFTFTSILSNQLLFCKSKTTFFLCTINFSSSYHFAMQIYSSHYIYYLLCKFVNFHYDYLEI